MFVIAVRKSYRFSFTRSTARFIRFNNMDRRQKANRYNKEKHFEKRVLNKLVKSHGREVTDESELMQFDQQPPAHLKGKAIGLWYRDKNRRKQAEEREARGPKVKKTPQEKAVESLRSKFYNIELSEYKEKQIIELLAKAQVMDPTLLPLNRYLMPFDTDEPEISDGKGKKMKKVHDDVAFVPYFTDAPCSSKTQFSQGNSTSELRGHMEDKYKHVEDSDFKRKFLSSISGTLEEKIDKAMASNYKLLNDPVIDANFKKELIRKLDNPKYLEMLEFRETLPSYKMKQEILDMIRENQIVVISGETGCGKTTQVPQFILDDMIEQNRGSECSIICTQPRRISAISIAERVAQERNETLGQPSASVGYQIRLERALPRKRGSILYCTAGIVPEIMQDDPILSGISHIVLDEIHERSMISDFLLTLLKDVTKKRKDLKLILMSATLNAEKFSEYFGGAPMIHIPGFTFPVEEYYLEDVFQMTKFQKSKKNDNRFNRNRDVSQDLKQIIEPHIMHLKRFTNQEYSHKVFDLLRDPELEGVNNDVIITLLRYISNKEPGAVLVFLPGWDTINNLHKTLTSDRYFNSSRFQILPLHSMLPTMSQKAIFNKPPDGVRKIVLATNIAETSITINDIVYVIDCGKTKMGNFDVQNNIATLKPEWITRANSKQRKGRAGRVQDGVCYHLYSRAREQAFDDYPLPEIQRTRLDEVVLKAKMLQLGKISSFLNKVMDPPDPASLQLSLKVLKLIDALDDDEHLTPLGYHLAKLPLDPQIGKMLLMASIFSCVDPVFTVAASLGFKDAFYCPMNMEKEVNKQKMELSEGEKCDYRVLINAMRGWEEASSNGKSQVFDYCRQNFLTNNTLLLLRDMKDQFTRHLHEMKFISSRDPKHGDSNQNSDNLALVRAVISSGLYPNVAVINKNSRFSKKTNKHYHSLITPDDGKVNIHPKSINSEQADFNSPFIMYYMKIKGSTSINLHDTSNVYPLPLIFFAHDMKTYKADSLPWNQAETKKERRKNKKNPKPHSSVITLRDCLSFECKPSTAKLIRELRHRLDQLLAHKLSHPGVTQWSDPNEGNILRAMIQLITNEDKRSHGEDYDDYSDDDDFDDDRIDKI